MSRNGWLGVRAYRRSGNRKPRDQARLRNQKEILGDISPLEEVPEMSFVPDFYTLDESYEDHRAELELRKKQIKYHIVKDKYFKEDKQPNFLTWAEKEQIRHLHKEDPGEWTAERLAESFPAVEQVIVKVLKADWTPDNMKRIERHDENVRKNWELFRSGQIKGLSAPVEEHLKKFSNRKFDSSKNAYIQTNNEQITFQFPQPKSKKFLQIVTSCRPVAARIAEKNQKPQIEGKQQLLDGNTDEGRNEIKLQLPEDRRREPITFDELVKATGRNIEANDEQHLTISTTPEENLVKSESKPQDVVRPTLEKPEQVISATDTQDEDVINLTPAKVSSVQVQKYAIKKSKVAALDTDIVPTIEHRIKIPKNLRRKRAVYRLYDSFYDEKGEFLYRVPGLVD